MTFRDLTSTFNLSETHERFMRFFRARDSSIPGPAVLIRQTITRYRERFLTLVGVLFAPLLLVLALGELARFTLAFTARKPTVGLEELILVGGAAILFVLSVAILLFAQIALVHAIASHRDSIRVHEAYRAAEPHAVPFVWLAVLLAVVVSGGFLLAIIPGIILFVRFSVAPFVLVREKERGMRAIVKSREYVRGAWYTVCGHLLVAWGVASVAAITAYFLIQRFVLSLFDVTILSVIIPAFIVAAAFPFAATYIFFLYEALARAKPLQNFSPRAHEVFRYLALGAAGHLLVGALFLVFLFKMGLL